METWKCTKNVARERIGDERCYLKPNGGYARSCVYASRQKAALATGEQVVDSVGKSDWRCQKPIALSTVLNLNNINR